MASASRHDRHVQQLLAFIQGFENTSLDTSTSVRWPLRGRSPLISSSLGPMVKMLKCNSLLASLRGFLFLVICSFTILSVQCESLDRRSLQPLSSEDISKLLTIQDPVKNLDPSNPQSHLSKILIPRAGKPINTATTETVGLVVP